MRKILLIFFLLLVLIGLYLVFVTIPAQAAQVYGPVSTRLSLTQRVQYSAKMLWYDGLLTSPLNPIGGEQNFSIETGEAAGTIALRLQQSGLIRDAAAFRDYLIYSGLDTSIQTGNYALSPASSAIDIAHKLQDATSTEATFVILPGWRMEEIAASLPTSGLPITPDEFISAAQTSISAYEYLANAKNVEGFLYPDTYILSRTTAASGLVDTFVRNFALHLTPDLRNGFERQGLTVYQAVTLASIVEREAVHNEEKPMIASVYLNRLSMGMKLEADPTTQYALGFNTLQNTWWTNPLSASDLQINSPFNTYLYDGLPPTPISNPGLASLQAVASPAETDFYYFRAKCDGSGYHVFSKTFEEHVQNACP